MEGLEITNIKEKGTINSVTDNKMDPSQFDATMKQLLVGQGAEKYVNIFRVLDELLNDLNYLSGLVNSLQIIPRNILSTNTILTEIDCGLELKKQQCESAYAHNHWNIVERQHNIGQTTLAVLSDADLLKLGVDDDKIRRDILSMVKDLPIFEELSIQKSSGSSQLSLNEITEILTESSDHLNRIYMSLYSTTRALSKEGVTDTLIYEDKFASDVAMSTLTEISNILDSMENVLQDKIMVSTKGNKQRKKIIVGALGSVVIITLAVLFARSIKQLK